MIESKEHCQCLSLLSQNMFECHSSPSMEYHNSPEDILVGAISDNNFDTQ